AASNAPALYARGLALLASGDVDGSVKAMRAAADTGGIDAASVHADLSAALLEQFRRTGSAPTAEEALREAHAALTSAPRPPQALFNRVMALDALGRTDAVAPAGATYLETDSRSAWADEVRRKIGR